MEQRDILAAVSSTVADVQHMTPGQHPGGLGLVRRAHVTFQTCGHDYVWYDWPGEGFPTPGDVVMCAVCIDALLKAQREATHESIWPSAYEERRNGI
jgi:hypothetical protein